MVRVEELGSAPAATSGPQTGGFAKLFLKVFDPDTDRACSKEYLVQKQEVSLGRSVSADETQAFEAAAEGVDLGAGFSNKLSRRHATIRWNQQQQRFEVLCNGKNGVLVVHVDTFRHLRPGDEPEPLDSYSTIMLGDCLVVLLLPKATHVLPGASLSPARGRHGARQGQSRFALQRSTSLRHDRTGMARDWHRIRSRWNKMDQETLLRGLMRYGFGRWKEIVQYADSGRLDRKPLDEMILMARRMVITAALHVTGAEYRAMLRILSASGESRASAAASFPIQKEIEQEVTMVAAELAGTRLEKRKYVRWARRLRLLHRIERLVHHPVLMQRIEQGELDIPGKPPAERWEGMDDADLLRGVYQLGFGDFHRFWEEPTLHFGQRFRPPQSLASQRPGAEELSEHLVAETEDPDEDQEESKANASIWLPTRDQDSNPIAKSTLSEAVTAESMDLEEHQEPAMPSGPPVAPLVTSPGPDNRSSPEIKSEQPPAADPLTDERPPFPSSVELLRRLRIVVNTAARLIESRKKDEPLPSALAAFAAEWPRPLKDAPANLRPQGSKRLAISRLAQQQVFSATGLDAAAWDERPDDPARLEWARRRLEKAQRFTRKQAMEFERTLVNHGLDYIPEERPDSACGTVHDWIRFVYRCPYVRYKLPETLEEAYIDFVRECYRVLATEPNDSREPTNADANASDEAEDEDRQAMEQTPFATEEKPDPPAADEAPIADSTNTRVQSLYASVSPEASLDPEMLERARSFPPSTMFRDLDRKRARKALTRLHLFRVLRLCLLMERDKSLAELLQLSTASSMQPLTRDLPPWWRAAHDRALLYGIDRHGLGLGAFEHLAQDRELGFPQSIEAYCTTRHLDSHAVSRLQLGFPRVQVALRRARTVIDSVCAAQQLAPLPTERSLYEDEARAAARSRAQQRGRDANWPERLVYQYLRENEIPASLTPVATPSTTGTAPPLHPSAQQVELDDPAPDWAWSEPEQPAVNQGRKPQQNDGLVPSWGTADGQRRVSLTRSKRRRQVFEQLRSRGTIAQGIGPITAEAVLTQPVDLGNGLVLLSLGAFPKATAVTREQALAFYAEPWLLSPGFRSVRQLSASGHWYETCIEASTNAKGSYTLSYRVQQVEFVLPDAERLTDCIVPVPDGFAAAGSNLTGLWIQLMNSEAETGLAAGTASFVTLVSGFERAGLCDPIVQRCLRLVPNAEPYLSAQERWIGSVSAGLLPELDAAERLDAQTKEATAQRARGKSNVSSLRDERSSSSSSTTSMPEQERSQVTALARREAHETSDPVDDGAEA
jgi:hypothetical protein